MPKKMDHDLNILGVSVVEGNPFAKPNEIPEDSEIAQLYNQSWDADGKPYRLETDDPDRGVKLLRKYAEQTGRGVRVEHDDNSVTFSARPRRAKSPAPVEERDDDQ